MQQGMVRQHKCLSPSQHSGAKRFMLNILKGDSDSLDARLGYIALQCTSQLMNGFY